MNNPLNMLKNKLNPQQLVMNMVGNSNPMIKNLINMAQKGDSKGVEDFARNFCKEQNLNFDEEFEKFINNMGIKNK